MYRDYWYVLIPVHLVTSACWLGGFYLAVKSGVDIGAMLEKVGTSPQYIDKVQNSEWAHLALAYLCYKVATPARYTITLGGTTLSIKYLRDRGYLRTTSDIRDSLKERGEDVRDRVEEEWDKSWQKFAERKKKKRDE